MGGLLHIMANNWDGPLLLFFRSVLWLTTWSLSLCPRKTVVCNFSTYVLTVCLMHMHDLYPFPIRKNLLHFQMCVSVARSTLSKDFIRNTKQHRIMVHGTDDLYLRENILYYT